MKSDENSSKKKRSYEPPKLKQNSRWQRNDVNQDKNRFQSSKNKQEDQIIIVEIKEGIILIENINRGINQRNC